MDCPLLRGIIDSYIGILVNDLCRDPEVTNDLIILHAPDAAHGLIYLQAYWMKKWTSESH